MIFIPQGHATDAVEVGTCPAAIMTQLSTESVCFEVGFINDHDAEGITKIQQVWVRRVMTEANAIKVELADGFDIG